jgi:hypothetical protein
LCELRGCSWWRPAPLWHAACCQVEERVGLGAEWEEDERRLFMDLFLQVGASVACSLLPSVLLAPAVSSWPAGHGAGSRDAQRMRTHGHFALGCCAHDLLAWPAPGGSAACFQWLSSSRLCHAAPQGLPRHRGAAAQPHDGRVRRLLLPVNLLGGAGPSHLSALPPSACAFCSHAVAAAAGGGRAAKWEEGGEVRALSHEMPPSAESSLTGESRRWPHSLSPAPRAARRSWTSSPPCGASSN